MASQLTETQFSQALAEFVVKFNSNSNEKWTLHKANDTICAKQSVMIKSNEKLVNRQAYITFNSIYGVPVLWFNVYSRDGCPLDAHETLGLLKIDSSLDLAKNISLNEHPVLGVLFYNIHPCKTADIMEELSGEGNYIAKWLSVYGSPIGVNVPPTLLASSCQSASSPISTETSRSFLVFPKNRVFSLTPCKAETPKHTKFQSRFLAYSSSLLLLYTFFLAVPLLLYKLFPF